MNKYVSIFLLFFLFFSCKKDETKEPIYYPALMEIPKGFPPMEAPLDNEFAEARWALGKKLFYETALSVDSSISCASCHKSELAFSDDVGLSLGVEGRLGTSNSISLANVGYHPYFTREGGVPTLEMQVLVPVQEHNEFDFNIVLIAERLAKDSVYIKMSAAAYAQEPNPFVLTRAIACFERSLISGNSAYDQFTQAGKTYALSKSAIRGKDLFFSDRTNCSKCHSDFNFTNYAFENNGLYETYTALGRMRVTGDEADRALFKVPSLRNIALTRPYMHDGSLKNLAAVVEHYQSGGKNHVHKSALIKPLGLSESEKNDLVAFLNSLTDEGFVGNLLFQK